MYELPEVVVIKMDTRSALPSVLLFCSLQTHVKPRALTDSLGTCRRWARLAMETIGLQRKSNAARTDQERKMMEKWESGMEDRPASLASLASVQANDVLTTNGWDAIFFYHYGVYILTLYF